MQQETVLSICIKFYVHTVRTLPYSFTEGAYWNRTKKSIVYSSDINTYYVWGKSAWFEHEFHVLLSVHCNIIIQYKPTECTFLKLLFQFLIFYFIHVLNSRVHLQGDGCIYKYGIVRFTYLVGSKSFRPDIQKPRQMENAVRDI